MQSGGVEIKELGNYLLLEQLAVGGMAEIYLAKTRGVAGFEKFLCLKVIHPDYADDEEFIEMLIDEAKISVGLNHVNIAQIFDLGRDHDTYYIAMEYVDGADLFRIMRSLSERDIDVPMDVAAFVAQEVCTGLDYAHRKRDHSGQPLNIIHRDISPQNILISRWGEVKVIDFGIAKAASRSQKTQAGVIKGKYYYMSPEQARGKALDARTDIFSAGIILYEVLTGQMLYLEEDMSKLLDMVRNAEIQPPSTRRPDMPPQLEAVVMKALAPDPRDRWQSAREFQVALTSFLYSYSPEFTRTKVASLLNTALGDDEEETSEVLAVGRPATYVIEDPDVEDASDLLVSAVDDLPPSEHSMIFRMEDIMPPGMTEEEDEDEKTQVTSMPSALLAELGPELEAADSTDYANWADDDPTTVSPQQTPSGLSPGGPTGEFFDPDSAMPAPPAEVVVQNPLPNLPSPEPTRQLTPARAMDPSAPGVAESEYVEDIPTELEPQVNVPVSQAVPTSPQVVVPRPDGWHNGPVSTPGRSGAPPPPQQQWQPQPQPQAPGSLGATVQASPEEFAAQGQVPPAAERTPIWNPNAVGPTSPTMAEPPGSPAIQPYPMVPPNQAAQPYPMVPPQMPDFADMATSSRRKRRALLAAVLVVGVLAAIGVGVFMLVLTSGTKAGAIEVDSVPKGATVSFDGKKLAKQTPVVVPVADVTLSHKVVVELAAHTHWNQEVTVPEGYSRLKVLAVLTPIYGKLEVRTTPPGAEIYVNGEHHGKTPVTVENIRTAEPVNLELKMAGYITDTRTLEWNDRTELVTIVTLNKNKK